MTSHLDVLLDWLQHPGTALLFAHIDGEWGVGGERFAATMTQLADSREDDLHLLRHMQQIAVTRREMLKLKAWPKEEVQRLRHLDEPTDSSVRPGLSMALAGQGRRGRL